MRRGLPDRFDRWPTGWGFDYFYGFLGGDPGQWDPLLAENQKIIGTPEGFYDEQQALVLVVFVVLATLAVAAPVVLYLVLGRNADSMLDGWRDWLTTHNAAIMCVVFLVFGFVLIGQGITGLST